VALLHGAAERSDQVRHGLLLTRVALEDTRRELRWRSSRPAGAGWRNPSGSTAPASSSTPSIPSPPLYTTTRAGRTRCWELSDLLRAMLQGSPTQETPGGRNRPGARISRHHAGTVQDRLDADVDVAPDAADAGLPQFCSSPWWRTRFTGNRPGEACECGQGGATMGASWCVVARARMAQWGQTPARTRSGFSEHDGARLARCTVGTPA
jgi:hypothetical protein